MSAPRSKYLLTHLSNHQLLQDFEAGIAEERERHAQLLALLGEVETRRLYADAGFESLLDYCLGELHIDEDEAPLFAKAATVGRDHPEILAAFAAGLLHLEAIALLSPVITEDNAAELIAAATHKTESEIENFLARRFS